MRLRAIALVLLVAPLLPAALAEEHAFQHRYLFEGRLIGANDEPIAGREVLVTVEGDELTTPCEGGHRSTTDEWGDFRFCWDHRTIRSGSRMTVTAGNASRTLQLDPTFRRSYAALRDTTGNGSAPEAWDETFRVTGRAWTVGPVPVEGTTFIGISAPDVPVNLTVRTAAGDATQNTTTDAYGDFAFTILSPDPQNTTIAIELAGRTQGVALDTTWHRNHAPYIMPQVLGAPTSVTPSTGAPGSAVPSMSPWLFVAIGAGLAAAVGYAVYAKRKR